MNHLTFHTHKLNREDREELAPHKGHAVLLTGLSGSGKSSLASELEYRLHHSYGIRTFILDGDNLRLGVNRDLNFSLKNISENNRRVAEIASLFINTGVVVIIAVVTPFKSDRKTIRKICGKDDFSLVYVKCSLDVCRQRDTKGLYKKREAGEINNLIGIDIDYEIPENPDFVFDTCGNQQFETMLKLEERLLQRIGYRFNHSSL